MPCTQEDLELLETFLDGALPSRELEVLNRRLSVDAGFVEALADLRAQRVLRDAVWRTLEPDDVSSQQLAWRVRGAMMECREHEAFSASSSPLGRWGTAAAACIVLGFFGGWLGRGNHTSPTLQPGQPTQSFVLNKTPQSPVFAPVTNDYGQIVAWQPFQNSEDANHFIEDLNRVHAPAAAAPLDDKINLTSYEKY